MNHKVTYTIQLMTHLSLQSPSQSQIKNIADMEDAEIIRVWNEIKASGSLNFKYREQATAYELAPFIASNMLTYPPNHIISAGYLLDDIDISLFRKYVSKLQPESAVTTLRSRTYSWLPDDTPNDASPPDENTPVGQGANRMSPGTECLITLKSPLQRSFNHGRVTEQALYRLKQ